MAAPQKYKVTRRGAEFYLLKPSSAGPVLTQSPHRAEALSPSELATQCVLLGRIYGTEWAVDKIKIWGPEAKEEAPQPRIDGVQ